MSRTTRSAGLLLTALVAAGCRPEAPSPGDGFVPLFNGRDLTGWVPVNTAPSTWTVIDGMLHCSGKPTGELRTERMYQNFELEVEWRHLVPAGNGGIFVWADDLTARGQPFHRGIEVQVLDHGYGNTRGHTTHGDVFPIHGARMTPVNGRGGSRAFPTELRGKPSPEWNHYRITCRDGEITLAVNGAVVTRGTDCTPRKGYICLESEGGQVDYRNLRIRELPDTPVAPEDVAVADRGYRTLYNGVDLTGWSVEPAGAGWRSDDWRLVHEGDAEHTLRARPTLDGRGFLFDLRASPGSGPARLLLGERELDLAAPPLAGTLLEGWNRFEGELGSSALRLSLNGRELLDVPAPAAGARLGFTASGPLELANLFTRPLPDEPPGTAR